MEIKHIFFIASCAMILSNSAKAASGYSAIDNIYISTTSLIPGPNFQPYYKISGLYSYELTSITGSNSIQNPSAPMQADGFMAPVRGAWISDDGFSVSEVGGGGIRTYGDVRGANAFLTGSAYSPYYDSARVTLTISAHTAITITADLTSGASIANYCTTPDFNGIYKCDYANTSAGMFLQVIGDSNFTMSSANTSVLLQANGQGPTTMTDWDVKRNMQITISNTSDQEMGLAFGAEVSQVVQSYTKNEPVFAVPELPTMELMLVGLVAMCARSRRDTSYEKQPTASDV